MNKHQLQLMFPHTLLLGCFAFFLLFLPQINARSILQRRMYPKGEAESLEYGARHRPYRPPAQPSYEQYGYRGNEPDRVRHEEDSYYSRSDPYHPHRPPVEHPEPSSEAKQKGWYKRVKAKTKKVFRGASSSKNTSGGKKKGTSGNDVYIIHEGGHDDSSSDGGGHSAPSSPDGSSHGAAMPGCLSPVPDLSAVGEYMKEGFSNAAEHIGNGAEAVGEVGSATWSAISKFSSAVLDVSFFQ